MLDQRAREAGGRERAEAPLRLLPPPVRYSCSPRTPGFDDPHSERGDADTDPRGERVDSRI